MWFAEGYRSRSGPPQTEPAGRSDVQREWLQSNPEPGEALVDTGLSSAADCAKLRWTLGDRQRAQFSELIAQSVARDRELSRDGGLEAEAQRITTSSDQVLKAAGLDPTTFGIPMPEKLSARMSAHCLHPPTNRAETGA